MPLPLEPDHRDHHRDHRHTHHEPDQSRPADEHGHPSADAERVVHRLWQFLDGHIDLDLATVHNLALTLARSAAHDRPAGAKDTDATDGTEGTDPQAAERYPIDRYGDRAYQVSDGATLIAVTVYRKGAVEVRRQLRQRDQRISDLEAVLAALLSALAHPDP